MCWERLLVFGVFLRIFGSVWERAVCSQPLLSLLTNTSLSPPEKRTGTVTDDDESGDGDVWRSTVAAMEEEEGGACLV